MPIVHRHLRGKFLHNLGREEAKTKRKKKKKMKDEFRLHIFKVYRNVYWRCVANLCFQKKEEEEKRKEKLT